MKINPHEIPLYSKRMRKRDPERPNDGKEYMDYLKLHEMRTKGKMEERMRRARQARDDRRRKGIDISIPRGDDFNVPNIKYI